MINYSHICTSYEDFKHRYGVVTTPRNSFNAAYFRHLAKHYYETRLELYLDNRYLSKDIIFDSVMSLSSCRSIERNKECTTHMIRFSGFHYTFYHPTIGTDKWEGVSEDGDSRFIRFTRYAEEGKNDEPHVYKKKAGKLLREVILWSVPDMPECLVTLCCETFAARWRAMHSSDSNKYTLHVDDDFASIYGCGDQDNDIEGSCMNGEDQYSFYEDSVTASAAYLTDENDVIVARCVIFDEVHDDDGNIYRYAERQYAKGGSLLLKQLLIDKLIADNRIDIYKEVGAGYKDRTQIIRVEDGERISTQLWIYNDIEPGDTLSFQDTFVFLACGKAYNHNVDCEFRLDTTDSELCGEWDEYHERYCECTVLVNVWDDRRDRYIEMRCDENDLDDFKSDYDDEEMYNECVEDYDGDWHRRDSIYISYSEREGAWFKNDDVVFSECYEDYIPRESAVNVNGDWYADYDDENLVIYDEDDVTFQNGKIYIAA